MAVIAAANLAARKEEARLLFGLTLLGLAGTVSSGDLLRPPPRYPQQVVADVLRLTSPSDYVMDLKGEAVFRQRPTKILLEVVGRDLLQRGVIEDTIAAAMQRTGTCVAVRDSSSWPDGARAFLRQNFIDAGAVRVCGQRLGTLHAGREVTFQIAIPARYGLTTREGLPAGSLDGVAYSGPRLLAAGLHTFRADEDLDDVTVLWARAMGDEG